jgi:phosphoribosylformylglycinamidine synthase
VHDVSGGGLAVTLAELAVRAGVGVHVAGIGGVADLFSESPSRVVACVTPDRVDEVRARAAAAGIAARDLGVADGERVEVDGLVDLALADVLEAWRSALPTAVGV